MKKWLLIYLLSLLSAGTSGKLTGFVYDADSDDPLIGCNVIINELSSGTATDLDGNFFLIDTS